MRQSFAFVVAQLVASITADAAHQFNVSASPQLPAAPGAAGSGKPNIIMILTDDLGWNSMYNNDRTLTPFIDSLAGNEGVKLTSHYTYQYCAPTRGSFMTGRFPYHLSATRENLIPWSLPDGVDLGYSLLPKHLAKAGYHTAHVGKWHLGFYSPEYTPVGRGFNSSFGFLEGGEDHWSSATFNNPHCKPNGVDLSYGWSHNGTFFQPAKGRNGTYTGYLFASEAVKVIEEHAAAAAAAEKGSVAGPAGPVGPLFLYLALHNTHDPVEVPKPFADLYNGTVVEKDDLEKRFNGMVSFVDETVRNVTEALKRTKMWEQTLLVWTTDNGAPVNAAGSNHPLRGGKTSHWEGGTRVPAFVSGGVLPKETHGRTLPGMAHICDWYATFSSLAGLGGQADAAGPAAPESLDLSPWLFGKKVDSPRNFVVYDHRMYTNQEAAAPTGGIRLGDLKLLVGPPEGMNQASWYGLFSPNNTGVRPDLSVRACPQQAPCLFNVSSEPGGDMSEHVDLAKERPEDLQRLLKVFESLKEQYHPPQKSPPREDEQYCKAMAENGGFVRPWKQLPQEQPQQERLVPGSGPAALLTV